MNTRLSHTLLASLLASCLLVPASSQAQEQG